MTPSSFLIKRALQENESTVKAAAKRKIEESGAERAVRYGRNVAVGAGIPLLAGGLALRPIAEAGKPLEEAADLVGDAARSGGGIVSGKTYAKAGPLYLEGSHGAMTAKVLGKPLREWDRVLSKLLGNRFGLGSFQNAHMEDVGGTPQQAVKRLLWETPLAREGPITGAAWESEPIHRFLSRAAMTDAVRGLKRQPSKATPESSVFRLLREPQHKDLAMAIGKSKARFGPAFSLKEHLLGRGVMTSPAFDWARKIKMLRALPYAGAGLLATGALAEGLRRKHPTVDVDFDA